MSAAAVAPPSALPPARATLRHRVRARRAAATPGVVLEGLPLLGHGVVLDLAGGASVVLGAGCVLMDGCRVHARGATVRIGAGAVLGERCAILAHDAVEVGPGALLADGVVLADFEHEHGDPERPVRLQGLRTTPVRVGGRARIGPGAVLRRGAVVPPAGAVEAHSVLAGGGA